MPGRHSPWELFGLLSAIVTLPLGLLSGLFLGLQVAAVVFIVGWFLLTPLFLVLGSDFAKLLAARRDDDSESDAAGHPSPREALKRRYVRGEISDEEFERRMRRIVEADHDPDTFEDIRDESVPSGWADSDPTIESEREAE